MYSENLLHGVGVEALDFVRDNLALILRLAAMLTALEAVLWIMLPPALALLNAGVGVFLTTLYAIALHRRILVGETRFPPEIDLRVLIFIALAIVQSIALLFASPVFVLVFTAAAVFGSLPAVSIVAAILILGLILAGLLWYLAKIALLFPHVAATPLRSISISGAWRLSQGLVASIILRFAVFGVATIGFGAILVFISPDDAEQLSLLGRLAASPGYFVQSLAVYLISACFVALASLIYQRAVNDLQAQSPPGEDV